MVAMRHGAEPCARIVSPCVETIDVDIAVCDAIAASTASTLSTSATPHTTLVRRKRLDVNNIIHNLN